ncbi:hypothetical protein N7474_010110 [Penicillium riverlandense]|uniref:uncharacterized protein n=1 Tax=Penicillium riverlandense TaxID=1903569 RepID=UPI002547AF17|nr:uncharacterized protein N7474_010110 [Penicillium riverlandense]KAJ5808841.1 hypothetical protein N7474_010110 [Penicillium riverlandense]
MTSISFVGNNHGIQVGDNRGSIVAEFHLHPERPETPPSPLSTVPFTRDPDFVSRSTLLHWIQEKSLVPGSRIALVGLGGVGKSQLAIEYSYRIRSESPATWVFWVYASNEARFEQSFRDIADQVKIPGRQDPTANIFKLVENWFRDERKGNWICILDNVDDAQFLCSFPAATKQDPTKGLTKASTKPLLEYIPRSRNGFIIITSRSREVASKMVDHKDLLEVKPMERSEALELLQRKLEQVGESQESRQLVEELEFMPLAIVQAASYIRNRAPRYSVSRYLRDFQESDREATKLLRKEAGYLYRDWEAKNSILVTWQMSFDYIRRTKPSASDLLSLMSFFDRQGILDSLIRLQPNYNCTFGSELLDGSSDGKTSKPDASPNFEDDVTTLRNYSFISVSETGTFFTMHRLVQLSTRAWLKSRGQIDQWRDYFISNLCEALSTGEYENWETCRPLFPHIKAAMSQRPASRQSRRQWATLLFRGAWYASKSGNITDVREMASRSRNERAALLGEEHEEVLDSTDMLAKAYWLEGQSEEAEKLLVHVIETRKTKLGKDHPDTLASIANLAATYMSQGRWAEAEQLNIQVMETRKTKLGKNHSDTLTSMANLAATYSNQGRWEEAEQLEVQVIETRKTKLGKDHPDTLMSMNNLATTYMKQGRWEEAEQLNIQVIGTRKTKLGKDHPDTLMSMSNLATTYMNQGRWAEAEQVLLQVIEMSKTKLGEDHPYTLTSMANLATTYWNQGRLEEAEKLEAQVMEMSKIKLGKDHPDTLISMNNLATTYMNQGRWEEAEKLEVQVIETCKTKLGEDHPDTLMSMANLASTYRNQRRWEEAEQLNIQVIETCKTKLGEDHPDTLMVMANLASTYSYQGRWEESEQLNMQVMKTRRTKLGEDHPETLRSMSNLSFTWKSSGRDAEAINILRKCLVKQKKLLGLNHPDTLSNSKTLLEWETELNMNS